MTEQPRRPNGQFVALLPYEQFMAWIDQQATTTIAELPDPDALARELVAPTIRTYQAAFETVAALVAATDPDATIDPQADTEVMAAAALERAAWRCVAEVGSSPVPVGRRALPAPQEETIP
jgi:hypothetical protein